MNDLRQVDSWLTRHSLRERSAELGLAPSPGQFSQLRDYSDLLLKWNRTYNLVGAKTPTVLVNEHLLDCLAIIPTLHQRLVASQSILIDMGSGGGLPGIVIAIMMPALEVVLVEPVSKKTAFLLQARAICHLPNVTVAECRMADLEHSIIFNPMAERLTLRSQRHFSSRAFAEMKRLIAEAHPHAIPGSRLFAMKSARLASELDGLQASTILVHELAVPGLASPRYLAEIDLALPPQATASGIPS